MNPQSTAPYIRLVRSDRFRRAAIATAVGIGSAAYLAVFIRQTPGYRGDFDHLYAAARYVIAGKNPYRLIGPGALFNNRFPLYYPLPAVLVLTPLTLVPLPAARLIFVAIVGSLFGFAVASLRSTRWRYLILLSREYFECVTLAHWTPLFYAMWFIPALNVAAIAKPTIGAAMVTARATRAALAWAVVGGAALLALSLFLQPGWIGSWWAVVNTADHFSSPLLRPGGFLLLAALLRWRVPEGRLLLALSLPPQTPSFYDPLLLFLVARKTIDFGFLVAMGWLAQLATGFFGPFLTMRSAIALLGKLSVWFLYLPALIVVLARPRQPRSTDWAGASE